MCFAVVKCTNHTRQPARHTRHASTRAQDSMFHVAEHQISYCFWQLMQSGKITTPRREHQSTSSEKSNCNFHGAFANLYTNIPSTDPAMAPLDACVLLHFLHKITQQPIRPVWQQTQTFSGKTWGALDACILLHILFITTQQDNPAPVYGRSWTLPGGPVLFWAGFCSQKHNKTNRARVND